MSIVGCLLWPGASKNSTGVVLQFSAARTNEHGLDCTIETLLLQLLLCFFSQQENVWTTGSQRDRWRMSRVFVSVA
jgi:hypothetical protein